MLAITRRVGESIVIGDPDNPIAVITLVEVKMNTRAVLAIDADRSVPVHRREVADKIQIERHNPPPVF